MADAEDRLGDPDALRARAIRYRELGANVADARARAAALELAEKYDALADALEAQNKDRGAASDGAGEKSR